jgi:hypothetical protein
MLLSKPSFSVKFVKVFPSYKNNPSPFVPSQIFPSLSWIAQVIGVAVKAFLTLGNFVCSLAVANGMLFFTCPLQEVKKNNSRNKKQIELFK